MVEISDAEAEMLSDFVRTPEGEALFSVLQDAKAQKDEKRFDKTLEDLRQMAKRWSEMPPDGVVFDKNGLMRPAKSKPLPRKIFVPDTYRFVRTLQPAESSSESPKSGYPFPLLGEDVSLGAASLGMVNKTAADTEVRMRPRPPVARRNNQGRWRSRR